MRLKIILMLLVVLATINLAGAQQKTNEAIISQPMDPEIYYGHLANGLTYYVRKNISPKKRAVLYLVERVGSTQEDDDQLGLAHFTEHMAFNGTRNFPKNELVSYLQRSGVKFGADVNAHTSYNQTDYELTLPTDSMQVFNKGLDILSDWAGHITFDPDELDRERNVILEEERLRMKTANGRMNMQTLGTVYNNSRFAKRLPIGTDDIIKNFRPETIKRFYQDWYRPDQQAVIIVGDFNPRQVVKLIGQKFSSLSNPANERPLVDYPIPPVEGTRVKILTDKELPYTYFSMNVRLPGSRTRSDVEYLERVETYLLNYMLNGRINEIAKGGNPPFMSASAVEVPSFGHTDDFITRITAKPGELERSVKMIMTELERAKKFGFTGDEFKTAKQWSLRGRGAAFYDIANHPSSSYADEYKRNFLEDEGIPGLEYEYNFTKNNIDKLQLTAVNELMGPYTSDQNRFILLEAPEKDAATLPDEKTLLDWVDNSGKDVAAYQGVQVGNSPTLPAVELQSGKIESTQSNASGAEVLTLSNGAKVILKNTDFSAGQILFDIYGPGGTSLASDEEYTSAALAGRLVSRSGVAKLSQIELDKLIANQGYGASPYITDYIQGIRGGSAPSRLEQAMNLIHLYFSEPRADSSVWAGLISQEKARLASRVNSPQSVFTDTAWAVLHSYNFRAGFPSEARLNAAQMNKAFDYYKQRFADASNFTFVFVGNLDNLGIRSLIKKYIASLPGTHAAQGYKNLHMDPLPGQVTKIVRKGIDDKSTVELVFHGGLEYNPENNMQLNALGGILQLRLTERLRRQESGVYSATARANSVNYPDGQYGVDIQFTCSSANADKLIAATLDEVEKIKQNGAEAGDIQKFIADETRSTQVKLKQNSFWVDFLSSSARNNEDPGFIKTYIASLDNVTVESTKASANKYLDKNNLIKLVEMPESK